MSVCDLLKKKQLLKRKEKPCFSWLIFETWEYLSFLLRKLILTTKWMFKMYLFCFCFRKFPNVTNAPFANAECISSSPVYYFQQNNAVVLGTPKLWEVKFELAEQGIKWGVLVVMVGGGGKQVIPFLRSNFATCWAFFHLLLELGSKRCITTKLSYQMRAACDFNLCCTHKL